MSRCEVVAVEGSFRTLHHFWEVIPSPTITKVIKKNFDHMIHDVCTEVRLSTVNGVIHLLGNPQSHEVLKVLLPRLGNLIMDSSSLVHAAVADLLILLNGIRNFNFNKVVSLDVLFSNLADDQPTIARKITKLLIPSYFPSKVTEKEACKRFITLIKRCPAAGARFCEFAASEGASLRSLMRLFKTIIGLTMSSVEPDKKQIEFLLVAASHLCTDLAKNASLQAALKEELSAEKLKTLFAVASSTRAKYSICSIISSTSQNAAYDIFEDCMGLITKCTDLPDDIERQAEVRYVHKMIVLCGWFDDMFEALVGFLQRAACGCHANFGIPFGKQDVKSSTRTKTRSAKKILSKSKPSKSDTGGKFFLEDYKFAIGIAWQIKDLLLSENTRKAILASGSLENAYSSLKVISEASIRHCLKYDSLNTYPVFTHTSLALHMSLHDIKTDSSGDSRQETISNLTLDHLIYCEYNLFKASIDKRPGKLLSESPNSTMPPGSRRDPGECQTGTSLTKQTRIPNMVKALTSILKFIVDAIAMNLAPRYKERSLNFTAESLRFIITNLREQARAQLQYTDQDIEDIIICLKSSITYVAKLLNTVLKSCEGSLLQTQAYNLVNELFYVIVSVEELLGYRYAARLITAVQPWFPDLILALGSHSLLKQTGDEGPGCDSSEHPTSHCPEWFRILAKMELSEFVKTGSDEELEKVQDPEASSALKRLVETMLKLVKASTEVLDAVGVAFLNGSLNALQSKDFDIVFGLVRFVCLKLVRVEDKDWKELKKMSASLGKVYSEVMREAEDADNRENDREKLCSAKALLEPVWTAFI